MRKGLFISVDGPNGAGKTTFIRTLVENLSVNYDVYDTRTITYFIWDFC